MAKDKGAVSLPHQRAAPLKLIIQKYFEKKKKKKVLWPRSWQTFPVKGQIVNILDLEGHVASVAITQF